MATEYEDELLTDEIASVNFGPLTLTTRVARQLPPPVHSLSGHARLGCPDVLPSAVQRISYPPLPSPTSWKISWCLSYGLSFKGTTKRFSAGPQKIAALAEEVEEDER